MMYFVDIINCWFPWVFSNKKIELPLLLNLKIVSSGRIEYRGNWIYKWVVLLVKKSTTELRKISTKTKKKDTAKKICNQPPNLAGGTDLSGWELGGMMFVSVKASAPNASPTMHPQPPERRSFNHTPTPICAWRDFKLRTKQISQSTQASSPLFHIGFPYDSQQTLQIIICFPRFSPLSPRLFRFFLFSKNHSGAAHATP